MSETDQVPTEVGNCSICDLRATTPDESIVHTDDLWTVLLVLDVPGWMMVTANRHSDDWLWGMSEQEASTLGPLIRQLSESARAEAGAERVYLMGFGEKMRHLHFMLLSRSESTPDDLRGPGMLTHAPELADRDEAFRAGARMRARLANATSER
jgi:diadenosine tetraphosphate (Ap4A) HIT family hydrolase